MLFLKSSTEYFFNKYKVQEISHFGVYGLVINKESILMIKKPRGPYTGMYDLPGGTPEDGETNVQTLKREFLEEAGIEVRNPEKIHNGFSEFAYRSSSGIMKKYTHEAAYYSVEYRPDSKIKADADGHDSLGSEWVAIEDIKNGKKAIPQIVMDLLKQQSLI